MIFWKWSGQEYNFRYFFATHVPMLKRFASKGLEAIKIIKCSETNNFMYGCVQRKIANEILYG
jgi:hypothetical protein